MSEQKDYLGNACQLGGLSPEDFQASFCIRCTQAECQRSVVGKSKFDHRVQTWESRLFTDVPRMDPSDLRFAGLSSAKFITLEPGLPMPTSDWVDSEDVRPTSIVVPASVKTAPRTLPVLNTPVRSGVMLQGAQAKPQGPQTDAWEPGAKIVKPGAKIKLGG